MGQASSDDSKKGIFGYLIVWSHKTSSTLPAMEIRKENTIEKGKNLYLSLLTLLNETLQLWAY